MINPAPNDAFRDRALGAVIGSAVGDALGAPFEFGKPVSTRRGSRGRCSAA